MRTWMAINPFSMSSDFGAPLGPKLTCWLKCLINSGCPVTFTLQKLHVKMLGGLTTFWPWPWPWPWRWGWPWPWVWPLILIMSLMGRSWMIVPGAGVWPTLIIGLVCLAFVPTGVKVKLGDPLLLFWALVTCMTVMWDFVCGIAGMIDTGRMWVAPGVIAVTLGKVVEVMPIFELVLLHVECMATCGVDVIVDEVGGLLWSSRPS